MQWGLPIVVWTQASGEDFKAQLHAALTKLHDAEARERNLTAVSGQQAEQIGRLQDEVTQLHRLRREMHNQLMEIKGNIRVFCRVRPSLG